LLLPTLPDDLLIQNMLIGVKDPILTNVNQCIDALYRITDECRDFDAAVKDVMIQLAKPDINDSDLRTITNHIDLIVSFSPKLIVFAEEYRNIYTDLDQSVSILAREDPKYNLREIWLALSEGPQTLVNDIWWERSKRFAQQELERIRDGLIMARQRLLNQRRTDFSEGMSTIWKKLRADKYSSFSQLLIPEPRGRGYPVEIEVKALLDDGIQKVEVDALRVFSDSQINVLGLAAFATRSKMLGQHIMILDDPVQSLDEDHFKTFAQELLPDLLKNKTQAIVLTHNDTFARELSYAFYDMDSYVTMHIRHSRRQGCQVEEGNRRVSERLQRAEKLGEDGNLDDAWLIVRYAMERLYTVTYLKYGPLTFNPFSWTDQTAEYMWNDGNGNGAGTIINQLVPGREKRLKEILKMTAAGAHDKSPNGFTDLMKAIEDLRGLMPALHIGG
jgi:hypothetical protein